MPRVARGLADGMIYHVINRGNGRQEVFHKDDDFQAFITLLREAKEKHPVKLLGYCLMSNHFHLLLSPDQADDLSKFMQWLMTSHVRRYHRHYRSSGHVWQGRYKSFIVDNDRHLLTVLRYIEGNPVRICLIQSADEWRWSSHGERLNGTDGNIVDALPLELPVRWTEYVKHPLDRQRTGENAAMCEQRSAIREFSMANHDLREIRARIDHQAEGKAEKVGT
jgi:putative transposase